MTREHGTRSWWPRSLSWPFEWPFIHFHPLKVPRPPLTKYKRHIPTSIMQRVCLGSRTLSPPLIIQSWPVLAFTPKFTIPVQTVPRPREFQVFGGPPNPLANLGLGRVYSSQLLPRPSILGPWPSRTLDLETETNLTLSRKLGVTRFEPESAKEGPVQAGLWLWTYTIVSPLERLHFAIRKFCVPWLGLGPSSISSKGKVKVGQVGIVWYPLIWYYVAPTFLVLSHRCGRCKWFGRL